MRRYKIYNAQLRLNIPKHFPGWIAGLKNTRIELELLQDLDMHLFIEDVVRGGISTMVTRHAEANHPGLWERYNPDKPHEFLQYYDANNLVSNR